MRSTILALPGLLTGCAASITQVSADQPHGIVELRFEQASRDFLYENKVSVDGREAVVVRSGERIRLDPGSHSLGLVSIAHQYGLGTMVVETPGRCVDYPTCTRVLPSSESRAALVEVGQRSCAQRLDLSVVERTMVLVRLQVAADQTCVAHAVPGAVRSD